MDTNTFLIWTSHFSRTSSIAVFQDIRVHKLTVANERSAVVHVSYAPSLDSTTRSLPVMGLGMSLIPSPTISTLAKVTDNRSGRLKLSLF